MSAAVELRDALAGADRAAVWLHDVARDETHHVRDAVRQWDAAGLVASVVHVAAANGPDRLVLVELARVPAPVELLALANVLAPFAWPDRPELKLYGPDPKGVTA